MFDIDLAGLRELESGREPSRLAFEPVANVFDEFRGYGDAGQRKRPTHCYVTLAASAKPRGVWLTVIDDGAGFANERDIWTFWGQTEKRSSPAVAGRFNAGEKQLIAASRQATVKTKNITVEFDGNRRTVKRSRKGVMQGAMIRALMPWTLADMAAVREALLSVVAPDGLLYTLDGETVQRPACRLSVNVTLPTVALVDGVLKQTQRKTRVDVLVTDRPQLCELGMPVCSLADVGFPFGLDIGQKVPVPQSRDMVATSYLYKAIGAVLEQAAMDGHKLLTEAEQESGFVKDALNYVREPEALRVVVESLYGENVVRHSSDPLANAKAAAAGAIVLPGRMFGRETRERFTKAGIMPTAHERFGGTPRENEALAEAVAAANVCPTCLRSL